MSRRKKLTEKETQRLVREWETKVQALRINHVQKCTPMRQLTKAFLAALMKGTYVKSVPKRQAVDSGNDLVRKWEYAVRNLRWKHTSYVNSNLGKHHARLRELEARPVLEQTCAKLEREAIRKWVDDNYREIAALTQRYPSDR